MSDVNAPRPAAGVLPTERSVGWPDSAFREMSSTPAWPHLVAEWSAGEYFSNIRELR